MFNSRRERCTLASVAVLFLLVGSVFSPFFWVGAAGEKSVTEDNLLFNDGTNAMAADLDLGGYNLTNADNLECSEPIGSYTWMVYVDPDNSSIYKAKHSNGTICWTSTNPVTVWNNVKSNGNKIFLGEGTFVLPSDFALVSNLLIEGCGEGTILQIQDDIADNVISGANLANITLKNLVCDGNEANESTGGNVAFTISFNNCTNINLENIHVINSSYDAFLFDANCEDVTLIRCKAESSRDDGFNPLVVRGVSFIGCIANDNTNDGFHFSVGSEDVLVSGCISHDNGVSQIAVYTNGATIEDCLVYGTGTNGIQVQAVASRVKIIGTHIYGNVIGVNANGNTEAIEGLVIDGNSLINQTSWAIFAENCPSVKITNNYIDGPISNYDGASVRTGSDWAVIMGNDFVNCNRYDLYLSANDVTVSYNNFTGTVSPSGSNADFEHNAGYVTENLGTQICASGENIVHGLEGTPTSVQVDAMNMTYDSVPVVVNVNWTAVDSTNINVGVYWTNGTAITDDTILVSWSAKYEP